MRKSFQTRLSACAMILFMVTALAWSVGVVFAQGSTSTSNKMHVDWHVETTPWTYNWTNDNLQWAFGPQPSLTITDAVGTSLPLLWNDTYSQAHYLQASVNQEMLITLTIPKASFPAGKVIDNLTLSAYSNGMGSMVSSSFQAQFTKLLNSTPEIFNSSWSNDESSSSGGVSTPNPPQLKTPFVFNMTGTKVVQNDANQLTVLIKGHLTSDAAVAYYQFNAQICTTDGQNYYEDFGNDQNHACPVLVLGGERGYQVTVTNATTGLPLHTIHPGDTFNMSALIQNFDPYNVTFQIEWGWIYSGEYNAENVTWVSVDLAHSSITSQDGNLTYGSNGQTFLPNTPQGNYFHYASFSVTNDTSSHTTVVNVTGSINSTVTFQDSWQTIDIDARIPVSPTDPSWTLSTLHTYNGQVQLYTADLLASCDFLDAAGHNLYDPQNGIRLLYNTPYTLAITLEGNTTWIGATASVNWTLDSSNSPSWDDYTPRLYNETYVELGFNRTSSGNAAWQYAYGDTWNHTATGGDEWVNGSWTFPGLTILASGHNADQTYMWVNFSIPASIPSADCWSNVQLYNATGSNMGPDMYSYYNATTSTWVYSGPTVQTTGSATNSFAIGNKPSPNGDAWVRVPETGAIDLDGNLATTNDQYLVLSEWQYSSNCTQEQNQLQVNIYGDSLGGYNLWSNMGYSKYMNYYNWNSTNTWYYASNKTVVTTSDFAQINATVHETVGNETWSAPGYWRIDQYCRNDSLAQEEANMWWDTTPGYYEWTWFNAGLNENYWTQFTQTTTQTAGPFAAQNSTGNNYYSQTSQGTWVNLNLNYAGLMIYNDSNHNGIPDITGDGLGYSLMSNETSHVFNLEQIQNISFVYPVAGQENGTLDFDYNTAISWGVVLQGVNGTFYPTMQDFNSIMDYYCSSQIAQVNGQVFNQSPVKVTLDSLAFTVHYTMTETASSSTSSSSTSGSSNPNLYHAQVKVDQALGQFTSSNFNATDFLNRSLLIGWYESLSAGSYSSTFSTGTGDVTSGSSANSTASDTYTVSTQNVDLLSMQLGGTTYLWNNTDTETATSCTIPTGAFSNCYQGGGSSGGSTSVCSFSYASNCYFVTSNYNKWDGAPISNDPTFTAYVTPNANQGNSNNSSNPFGFLGPLGPVFIGVGVTAVVIVVIVAVVVKRRKTNLTRPSQEHEAGNLNFEL